VLSVLPKDELHRVSDALLNKFYHEKEEAPICETPLQGAQAG
jgi:hypothetical protein